MRNLALLGTLFTASLLAPIHSYAQFNVRASDNRFATQLWFQIDLGQTFYDGTTGTNLQGWLIVRSTPFIDCSDTQGGQSKLLFFDGFHSSPQDLVRYYDLQPDTQYHAAFFPVQGGCRIINRVGRTTPIQGCPDLASNILHTGEGNGPIDWLGTSISGVGDINNDGRNDFAVTAPEICLLSGCGDPFPALNAGYFQVRSGLDGSLIYEKHPPVWDDRIAFGNQVKGGETDVDGDGLNDLIVSAPGQDGEIDGPNDVNKGAIHVYTASDPSGGPVKSWYGENQHDALGSIISNQGDMDGDGYEDIAGYSAGYGFVAPSFYPRRIQIFSGFSGNTILDIAGGNIANPNGTTDGVFMPGGGGDFNGDGLNDLVHIHEWEIKVKSILGQDLLLNQPNLRGHLHFKWPKILPDINGDGHADLGVSNNYNAYASPHPQDDGDMLHIIDGQTSNVLFAYPGFFPEHAASRNYTYGDVDGDGDIEFIIKSHTGTSLLVYSSKDGRLKYVHNVGQAILGLANVGDMTGDSIDDIVAGTVTSANELKGGFQAINFNCAQ